jgi:MFS family permease
VIMAQLSPLLLAPLGGVFADRFRRKPYLIACQVQQLVFSLLLAVVVAASASIGVVVAVALAIGIGNALNAPAWSAVMPQLVRKENMPGAISMNSAMVNGSRVVGPAIVAVLVSAGLGSGGIFAINAATYLFVIVALLSIVIADPAADTDSFRRRLGAGFREARHNPVVGRGLTILVLFSLLCLPYVGQFATVAARNFGVADGSRAYYWIYAVWGFGACCGGLSIATVLSRIDPKRLVPAMLLGFAVSLAVFSLLRSTDVPGRFRARLLLFRHDDVVAHGGAAAPRRPSPRPGDGAVVHGLRWHGAVRFARGWLVDGPRGVGDHRAVDRIGHRSAARLAGARPRAAVRPISRCAQLTRRSSPTALLALISAASPTPSDDSIARASSSPMPGTP